MQFHDALGDWSARPGPLYARLAASIREAVGRGDIPPGAALPPERSLARRLAIGRTTVTGAYAQLRSEELVESRQGSGTWVRGAARTTSGESPRESLPGAALRDAATFIDLATAALPAPQLMRSLLATISADAADVLETPGYLPGGLPALRNALAARLTAEGLTTSPDEILVTTGGQQALSLLCAHVLGPGDAAVVEDPTCPGILDVLHGLPVAIRSARPVAFDHGDVIRMADRSQARLVYVVPTLGPHGRVLGHADRAQLARALAGRAVLAVDDTGQAGLTFEPSPPPLAAFAQSPNLITIGSLTKLHWGGLRLGWIRGPASLIAGLTRAKVRTDLGSPVLDQMLAVRLLGSEDQIRGERLTTLRGCLRHAETLLPRLLPDFSWQPPEGGLNLWLRMPAGTGSAFTEVAARLGVAVVPGALLSHQAAADDHIRLAYVRPADVFEEGVRRLAAAWNHYQRAAGAPHTGHTAPVLI
jgi:DNA-binding transcriptional MocR family regulator